MSLRRRVLLGFLVVAVALVVTNVVLARAFERDLLERVDEELTATATGRLFAERAGPGRLRDGIRSLEPLSELYIAVADADGSRIVRLGRPLDAGQSPPSPTAKELMTNASHATAPRAFTVGSFDGSGSWRMVALTGRFHDGSLLVVATDLAPDQATLRQMRLIQAAGSAIVLAALGAVLWWVLRLGVRPLVAMAATADEIAAGDLSRRVDHLDERTEAGRLGVAFNAMLVRIEEAFWQRDATEERLRQFAADASHELRTPLTSIQGYADLWQAGGLREPGQLDQAMRRLSDEARRMGALVEDLLLLARLDQQRPLERQPVRVDLLAADAVADALVVEPDRPIVLHAVPAVVDGDELRLRQVMANLVTNARTHTPEGVPIEVRVELDGPVARLLVRDEGPGMGREVAARVFERFYRADTARVRSTGGSGLGLAIVDAIARSHGGTARAISAPGEGSTFIVELPLPSPDSQETPSDPQGSGRTVGP